LKWEKISGTLHEDLSYLQFNVPGDIKQPSASYFHVKWYQAITTAEGSVIVARTSRNVELCLHCLSC